MKTTKKILSLLLVMAMIFTLAVPVFAAEEPQTAVKADAVAAGDQVVIYNAGAGKVMSAEGYTYVNKSGAAKDELKSLDAVVADGEMTVPEGAAVLTVAVNEAGQYSFVTADGKYLYADGTNVRLVEEQGENTLFVLETADGGFFIKCANAQYSGKAQYIEYYSNYFTVYGMNDSKADIYTFQFFKVEKEDTVVEKELAGKTVIMHTNDVHGAIEGYAKVAALKAEYEAKGADVILVDAGDYSQGTTSVSLSKGANAIDMMNLVGYDYATLGNHEFDYGWPQLKENLSKADFEVLCANVFENDELLYDGHAIKEVNGVKIGFFGMETPEAQTKVNPALIKGLTFLAEDAMYAAAQAEVDALKAEGADVIICIGHLGIDDESEPNRSVDMLAKVEGVDFFIDGHSHTVMEAGPNGEAMQSTGTGFFNIGVIVIDNATKAIEDNYLVQLKHIEEIDDEDVTIVDYEPADETIAAAAKAINDEIDEIYGKVFAKSEVDLNGDKAPNGNRDSETNLGDLIADSMLWTVLKEDGAIRPGVGGVVAITNGGGIRAWIHKGDITMKDVNTVLPFGNTVAVVYVTGAELLEALEASTYCTPTSVGGFPQVAGIDFSIAVHNEYAKNAETYPGSTYYGPASINRVTINSVNGEDFDPEATYAVVTNNFCAAGGDTYYAFAAATAQFDTGIPMDEALMAYITEELDGVVGEEYLLPQGRITMEHVWTEWEVAYPCCYPGGGLDVSECDVCGEIGIRLTEENLDDHSNDPFNDIANSWAHDYIIDDYVLGLVNGYEDGSFKPAASVTRAEYITMLWRAAGEEAADVSALKFADAGSFADWYAEAVAWGVENGIIKGYEDNTFRPNAVINRAEMATFTVRYLAALGVDTGAASANSYADSASIPAWAAPAVNFLTEAGIMDGVGGNLFAPYGTASRDMAAKMIFCTLDFYWNVLIEEAA